ncbi:uncharacterized protein LOC107792465 isoform X2 [Nicotiana tabacum]|uniref:Uncharacterized protein LOC107792465 isoform X2 n=1 Tax=Nicotiana tabacum TaxID=4097 RepID=A0A1S4A0N4_TOBAC|nr:PREDICTED: uncharacterized protein LOC107792465 isoform X2 [Nicotiana tabacum]
MQRIHVSVRVRPLSPEDAKSSPWRISDRIFEEECRTLEIYKAQAENIVSAAIQGFNVLVLYNSKMGGCEEGPDTCTNKTCKGHEVDLMHFSIGKAIPGRLYGGNLVDNSEGNGADRFGHLVDLYGWNPHCRYLDGIGPSGFVKDDSPYSSSNQSGAYYFEFSRPLRTMDRLQQDAQFTIGKTSKMSVAFWYPIDGKPWHGSGHFSVSCNWIPLDILPDGSELTDVPQRSPWDTATAFSLLFSVVAFCISIFVGHRVSRTKNIAFTPMDNL